MKLTIVTPVLDDWDSCGILLGALERLNLPGVSAIRVLIVDDGSATPAPDDLCGRIGDGPIGRVELLELACNLGHQRAIALGIAVASETPGSDAVVVMDSDGEDPPQEIPRLLARLAEEPAAIVAAGRARRSESRLFRLGYAAYQLLFWVMTGRTIRFGNFSAFTLASAQRLARMSDTWNHLAAAMLRSKLPVEVVPTSRASRYRGRSHMAFPALIAHGFSAFSVFSEYVFARLFLFSCLLAVLALGSGAAVIAIRLLTTLAIPGWATTAVGVLGIVLLQAVLLCLIASVQLLAARSQAGAIPLSLVGTFVRRTRVLAPREDAASDALRRH